MPPDAAEKPLSPVPKTEVSLSKLLNLFLCPTASFSRFSIEFSTRGTVGDIVSPKKLPCVPYSCSFPNFFSKTGNENSDCNLFFSSK